jgi:integrase
MPRLVRDARLETRSARARLAPRGKPYWRALGPGLHVGYRKGKDAGRWVVRWYLGEERYQVKTLPGIADDTADADGSTILDYAGAVAKARALHAAPTSILTVRQACESYVAYLRAERRTGDDTERRLALHVLTGSLADRKISELTKTDLENWKRGMVRRDPGDSEVERRSQDTANRLLTMLKAALSRAFAEEANHIPNDAAWRRVKPFHDVARPRKLALDAAQRQRLINATSGAFRNLVIATLYSGSRPAPGEVAQAHVRDFHPELGVIHIRRSKTGPRDVPLSDEGVSWFKTIAAGRHPDALLLPKDDGTAWGYNHQIRPMRHAVERAKLPKETTLYTLRHSFASEHIMRGTDLKTLSESWAIRLRC